MKTRLRAGLRAAIKHRHRSEAALTQHPFGSATSEVDRRLLGGEETRDLLTMEIEKRELAAAELDRLGQPARADALRAEIAMTRRYLEERD